MTIQELRQALTEIEDQDMTIAQLRALLFAQSDQDQPVELTTLAGIEREAAMKESDAEERRLFLENQDRRDEGYWPAYHETRGRW